MIFQGKGLLAIDGMCNNAESGFATDQKAQTKAGQDFHTIGPVETLERDLQILNGLCQEVLCGQEVPGTRFGDLGNSGHV